VYDELGKGQKKDGTVHGASNNEDLTKPRIDLVSTEPHSSPNERGKGGGVKLSEDYREKEDCHCGKPIRG